MGFRLLSASLCTAALLSAGCASLPPDRGYSTTSELVRARVDAVPAWSFERAGLEDSNAQESLTEPLTAARAVELALRHSPRTREIEARLGRSRADLEDARRASNPGFGYTELDARDTDGQQITRSFSLGLSDLLLLSARKRLASGELDRQGQLAAAGLLDLATEVEVAWCEAVAARQVARLRETIAGTAANSAELAQRFFAAGNLDRLALARERAAAEQARIDANRAHLEANRARRALGGLIGLKSEAEWQIVDQLPEPEPVQLDAQSLVAMALEQRLDLTAARLGVGIREDALGITRRWRWLGSVEVGYEHESEVDGEVLRGPSLALQLPIFNQGQGAVGATQAELLEARARLDALTLDVDREARIGLETLEAAYEVSERYRTALVPEREAVVERTQEQVNYMLLGVFDLLAAKQDEYDAYQGYLDSVRDYWVARARLRSTVGGRLPALTSQPGQGAQPATSDESSGKIQGDRQ